MTKISEGCRRFFVDVERAGLSIAINAMVQVSWRIILVRKLGLVVPLLLAFFLGLSSVATAGSSIVIVDFAVQKTDVLLRGLAPDVPVYFLNKDRDGLAQIADITKFHKNLDAIHLISHGRKALLELGGKRYSAKALEGVFADDLKQIGKSLAEDGDILLYGCDIGARGKGANFLSVFARLTGADVAASDDTTGSQIFRGNWNLEKRVGHVEASIIVAKAAQKAWNFELANSQVVWDTRPNVNFLTSGTDVVSVDGITVTTNGGSTGTASNRINDIRSTLTYDGFTGVIASQMNANTDNGSVTNFVGFAFSEPVYNLTFTIVDVDGGTSGIFNDGIQFGSDNGMPTAATGSNVSYNAGTGFASANGAFCNAGSGNVANCLLTPTFAGPVTTVSVVHSAFSAAGSNPQNQVVVIDDLTFNTPPDATDNSNATDEDNSVAGNVLTDDSGSGTDSDRQDGTNLIVVSVDGSPVPPGGLTIDHASGGQLIIFPNGSYTFNPDGDFDGLTTGDTPTVSFSYTVEDQEGLSNSDGSATDSVGNLTITINGAPDFGYSVSKLVDITNVTALPTTLTYTITVNNTGDSELNGVSPADVLAQGGATTSLTVTGPSGDSDSDGRLDVGETWVYAATHAATQSEMDDGQDLVNTVNVTTSDTGATVQTDTATTTLTPNPSIQVSKTSATGSVSVIGEVITYTITVLNDGNVSATGLTVTDSLATPVCTISGTDLIAGIAPGASETCSVNYTVTTADFALGGANDGGGADGDIDNIAAASGTAGGSAVSDNGTFAVTLTINPQLEITKTANLNDEVNGNGLGEVGETITYTFTVENIGNVSIANVSVNDTHTGSGPALTPAGEILTIDNTPAADSTDSGDNGVWELIGPGDTVTFTAIYTITQIDVDTLQ